MGDPVLAGRRSPRWALMERLEIPDLDEPDITYLTRWRIVQTPWFGLYVHRLTAPDSRPTLHDHPWPFLSIVLWGGYDEARSYTADHVSIRLANVKRSTDTHWISRLHRNPTWTLLLVGRRSHSWGYAEPDGTWTRFDLHPHNDEFIAAMAHRSREDHVKETE